MGLFEFPIFVHELENPSYRYGGVYPWNCREGKTLLRTFVVKKNIEKSRKGRTRFRKWTWRRLVRFQQSGRGLYYQHHAKKHASGRSKLGVST
jgi:hypothetical protein